MNYADQINTHLAKHPHNTVLVLIDRTYFMYKGQCEGVFYMDGPCLYMRHQRGSPYLLATGNKWHTDLNLYGHQRLDNGNIVAPETLLVNPLEDYFDA